MLLNSSTPAILAPFYSSFRIMFLTQQKLTCFATLCAGQMKQLREHRHTHTAHIALAWFRRHLSWSELTGGNSAKSLLPKILFRTPLALKRLHIIDGHQLGGHGRDCLGNTPKPEHSSPLGIPAAIKNSCITKITY